MGLIKALLEKYQTRASLIQSIFVVKNSYKFTGHCWNFVFSLCSLEILWGFCGASQNSFSLCARAVVLVAVGLLRSWLGNPPLPSTCSPPAPCFVSMLLHSSLVCFPSASWVFPFCFFSALCASPRLPLFPWFCPPPNVPEFIVTYSLIVFLLPIISLVCSPLYFKSYGSLPIEANG